MKRVALLMLVIWGVASAEMRKVQGEHPFVDWDSWKPLGLAAGYFSISHVEEETILWFGAGFEGKSSLIRLSGEDLTTLQRTRPQFDTRLVQKYDLDLNGIPLPIMSRTMGTILRDGTEVVQASIGPRYQGGGSELYPVLFARTPGEDWTYLGLPPGDPTAFLKAVRAKKATVRCEAGGVVQLPDDSLRMYCHGMVDPEQVKEVLKGERMTSGDILIAEAASVHGPWAFRRDTSGSVVDITKGSGLPWLFPHVQKLGEHGYMLTGAEQWPPKVVYAAYSQDGVQFHLPVDEDGAPIPLLRMEQVQKDARFCKTVRGSIDPATGRMILAANVSTPSDRGASMLYAGGAEIDLQKLGALLEGSTP